MRRRRRPIGDGEVVLGVTDDGATRAAARAAAPASGGHGSIGMRERAALDGGELVAGPRPEGGWRVAARLPYAVNRPVIRVAVADDQPLVRAGIRAMLDQADDLA